MENPFETEKTRPTFLTVLCILTFIGSGMGLLSNLMSIATSKVASNSGIMSLIYESMNKSMEEVPEAMVDIIESSMQMAAKAIEYGAAIGITNFILYAISIYGAVMMYNLKKNGFYFYAAAQILLLFVAPIIIGFNILIVFGLIFSLLFTAAFIIMYGVNVKHMN